MILMRMAQYEMIDPDKIGAHRFDIGDHPVRCSCRKVVLRSGIVDEREIGPFNKCGKTCADIDDMHLDAHARDQWLRAIIDDDCPAFAHIARPSIQQPDLIPSGKIGDEFCLLAWCQSVDDGRVG